MSETVAEFASANQCERAIYRLKEARFEQIEVFMPYPEKKLLEATSVGRSPLPRFVFAAGLCGALVAYCVLFYTNVVEYPLNVGGRPLHPVPAFVPITFETTILFAGTTAFVVGFLLCGLPRFHHPLFEVKGFERVSVDGWFLSVQHGGDPVECERCRNLLVEAEAYHVQSLSIESQVSRESERVAGGNQS